MEAMKSCVEVPLPPPYEPDKWKFVIESLVGGLDYSGVVMWMAMHDDLDAAVEAARKLRA